MGLEMLGPYLAHVHLKNACWTPVAGTWTTAAPDGRPSSPRSPRAPSMSRPVRGARGGGLRRLGLVRGLLDATAAASSEPATNLVRPRGSRRCSSGDRDAGTIDRRSRPRLASSSRMTLRGRCTRVLLLLVVFVGSLALRRTPNRRRAGARPCPPVRRAEAAPTRRGPVRSRARRARAARAGPRSHRATASSTPSAASKTLQQDVQDIAVRAYVGARGAGRRACCSSAATSCSTSVARRACSTAPTRRTSTRSTSSPAVRADLERDRRPSRGREGRVRRTARPARQPRLDAFRTNCSSPDAGARPTRDAVRGRSSNSCACRRGRAPGRRARVAGRRRRRRRGRRPARLAARRRRGRRRRRPAPTAPASKPTTDETADQPAADRRHRVPRARCGHVRRQLGRATLGWRGRTRAST